MLSETLDDIRKDLAASFEQFRLSEGSYMSGTPASSEIAADMFMKRFDQYAQEFAYIKSCRLVGLDLPPSTKSNQPKRK